MKGFKDYWDGILFGKEFIDEDMARQVYNHATSMCRVEISKLQSENKKLRECVKFYGLEDNWYGSTSSETILRDGENVRGDFYMTGGKLARRCLKEIE